MATRIYVSNIEAGFFTNNSLVCGPNIPNKGHHEVGDIIISSVQQNDIFGWVCVKAGDPGEWEVICDIVEVKNGIKLNSDNISRLITRIANAELKIVDIDKDIEVLDGRIKVNAESIVAINTQVDAAKKTLVILNNQITNNTNKIKEVENNIEELEKVVDNNNTNNIEEINNLKTIVDANADAAGEAATGLMKEINDLKEIVGNNAEAGEQVATGIIKEVEDIQNEINNMKDELLKFWVGTQEEYDALETKESGRLYIIIN